MVIGYSMAFGFTVIPENTIPPVTTTTTVSSAAEASNSYPIEDNTQDEIIMAIRLEFVWVYVLLTHHPLLYRHHRHHANTNVFMKIQFERYIYMRGFCFARQKHLRGRKGKLININNILYILVIFLRDMSPKCIYLLWNPLYFFAQNIKENVRKQAKKDFHFYMNNNL